MEEIPKSKNKSKNANLDANETRDLDDSIRDL